MFISTKSFGSLKDSNYNFDENNFLAEELFPMEPFSNDIKLNMLFEYVCL